jgi:NAD(P)-dependent dehydrogenase (short-subunit alcohol dehydrogenase family)
VTLLRIAVIDGQGGGIGKAIIEKLRAALGYDVEIIALGTNSLATSLMLKAGANEGATGENAIVVNAPKVDAILGSVAILSADSMLGEVTQSAAAAVGRSPATKILLPLNRCGILIAGVKGIPLLHYIDDAVELVRSKLGGTDEQEKSSGGKNSPEQSDN